MSARDNDTTWRYINFWESMLCAETDRSFCIKMPEGSKYEGFSVWVVKKFVNVDKKVKNALYMSVPDNFEFSVKKQEKNDSGKYVTVEEAVLTVDELAEEFDDINKEIADKHNESRENYKFDRKKFEKSKEKSKKDSEKKGKSSSAKSSSDDDAAEYEFEKGNYDVDSDDGDDDDDDLDFEG